MKNLSPEHQHSATKQPKGKKGKLDAEEDIFGKRPKSEVLLLPSQVEIMREVFERNDKYNDFILIRQDFLMALRTDDLVVDFIDADAVRCTDYKRTVLTLDQVLTEVDKDEQYEKRMMSKSE